VPYPCDADGHGCPAYAHTPKAPLCLILYGSALACFALAGMVGSAPDSIKGDLDLGLIGRLAKEKK
jgi:hypothetical protein